MLTTRFAHVPALPEDDRILAVLSDLAATGPSGEPIMRIGIVGPAGNIYRLLLVHGSEKHATALKRLATLGLVPMKPYAGMDAVVRKD